MLVGFPADSARLAPSNPSSGLGGLTLSPHDFQDFRQHGPRMRVDDLDAPCGDFVARAHLHGLRCENEYWCSCCSRYYSDRPLTSVIYAGSIWCAST